MRNVLRKILKVLKWVGIVLASIIVLFFLVRSIGRMINNITPKGGINETMYVDVNGQEMWINIYGQDKNNPVLLYLHGGPGYSSSFADYKLLRKLSEDYTVVNWDQRSCGKTWLKNQDDTTPITLELMRSDIDVMTDYILEYLDKDKLTVMGISWGSFYALDFAYNHPEKTECCIGLSQALGYYEGEPEYMYSSWVMQAEYLKVAGFVSDEDKELAKKIDTDELVQFLIEASLYGHSDRGGEGKSIFFQLKNKYKKELSAYMHEHGETDLINDCDENMIAAALFCPYYNIVELYKANLVYSDECYNGLVREMHTPGEDNCVLDRKEYQCPVYFFLAEDDLSCNPKMAEEYLNSITAPAKGIGYTTGGHEDTLLHSDELVKFIHENVLK